MNQALGKVQTPKNPGLVLACFFSFVTDDEFFPKWNACRVDGQTQMTLLQRKLMTIFSPPPTIHLVVVTSLPFGFALMSRRGVNQTFFCENNQNSIKHLCIQNTKFLCMENTRNRIEKTKICWFSTSRVIILFVVPRIFLKTVCFKKAVCNHQLC